MTQKKIGILRGGRGEHYNSSLKKGGGVISYIQEHLNKDWKPIDILVDKEGVWHLGGIPITPINLFHKVDTVWNFSHPSFSQILSNFAISNTNINPFSSVLENNRKILEEHMKKVGINMPRSVLLPSYQEDIDGPKDVYAFKKAREVFVKIPPAWIVRPLTEDKDMGVHVAKNFAELIRAIKDGIEHDKSILVEELIGGKIVYSHSIAGFRGENLYHLPIKEIKEQTEKNHIYDLSKKIFDSTGANNYLKCNFVINPKRGVFLTSIELFPDLNKNSHFSKACEMVSSSAHHVLKHILDRTVESSK